MKNRIARIVTTILKVIAAFAFVYAVVVIVLTRISPMLVPVKEEDEDYEEEYFDENDYIEECNDC